MEVKTVCDKKTFVRCLFLLVAICLPGCETLKPMEPPHRVVHQEEAGSTHVAVLSVARWDDYVKELQPNFALTAEDALARAGATTQDLEDKFVSSVSTALKLAPPTSSVTTSHASGSPEMRNEASGPGDVSKVATPTAAGAAVAPSSLPPATSVLATPPMQEPMLQYSLATALFQEITLINRYVKDATALQNFDPYVVRMQVTLLPLARREPYDAYSTISFFVDEDQLPKTYLPASPRTPSPYQDMLREQAKANEEAELAKLSRERNASAWNYARSRLPSSPRRSVHWASPRPARPTPAPTPTSWRRFVRWDTLARAILPEASARVLIARPLGSATARYFLRSRAN